MLAKSKLNSIETLMSQTLIGLDISQSINWSEEVFVIKQIKNTVYRLCNICRI